MKNYTLTLSDISDYAVRLRAEERSAATVTKYLRDARAFAAWLEGSTVTKEETARWKARLLDQGLAHATVNAKLSAVNGLFRSLGWEDCRVKFLKVQRRAFRDAARELTP